MTATVAAAAGQHHGGAGWLYLLAIAAVVYAGWRVSLRLHPWTHCRTCGGDPRSYGTVYAHSFSLCPACGGSGRRLRRGAKDPTG